MILNCIKNQIGHVIACSDVLDTRKERVVGVDLLEALHSFAVQYHELRYLEHDDETRVFNLADRVRTQAQISQQLQVHQIVEIANVVYLNNTITIQSDITIKRRLFFLPNFLYSYFIVLKKKLFEKFEFFRYAVNGSNIVVGQIEASQKRQLAETFDFFKLIPGLQEIFFKKVRF